MTTVALTEFRAHASEMFTQVEHGETLVVLRHGRAIAKVVPIEPAASEPSWKKPALRLVCKGAELTEAILAERNDETLS